MLLKPFEGGGGSSTGGDESSSRGQEGLLAGAQAASGIDSFTEHVGAASDVGSGSGRGGTAAAGEGVGAEDSGGGSRLQVRCSC